MNEEVLKMLIYQPSSNFAVPSVKHAGNCTSSSLYIISHKPHGGKDDYYLKGDKESRSDGCKHHWYANVAF